jgi:CBS domain-containing protein
MATVQDVLNEKGFKTVRVEAGSTVAEAARCMRENRIGAVLVFDGERMTGILSERDIARKVVAKDKLPGDVTVAEVMTSDVRCVRPEMTMEDCMGLMTEKIIRHLPVLAGDKVAGIISVFDVVKHIIGEQRTTIQNLKTEVLIANDNMHAFF